MSSALGDSWRWLTQAALPWAGAALALLVLPGAWADNKAAPLALAAVAPGVYVYWGAQEDSSPSNQGGIANIGVVVGERCAAVIDTGGSAAFGQRLRQSLTTLTDKPVCAVINTHGHPDHLLGNAAFAAAGAKFYGHANLPESLAVRGRSYLAAAQRELGVDVAGHAIHAPTEPVQGQRWLDLGQRRLLLQAHPTAHTSGDLTVLDEATQTLFSGDLLFVDHVPVVDGSVRGWLKLTDALAKQRFAQVVPGHGPLVKQWPQGMQSQTDYLQRLLSGTRTALAQGRSLQEAMVSVAPENTERWLLFDLFHRRNIAAAYTELEWE